jgi:DNA-binding GntR family transcriptional regulator
MLCSPPSQKLLEDIRHPVYDVDQSRSGEGEMLREPTLVAESVASDEERARLALFPGEMVYRVDRIRRHGEQLFVENLRLPAALFPSLRTATPRINDLADAYGLQLGEAVERVCAVAASADIANDLGVTEGALLLMSDRVVYLRDGRPAEWRISYSLDQGNLARLKARLGS